MLQRMLPGVLAACLALAAPLTSADAAGTRCRPGASHCPKTLHLWRGGAAVVVRGRVTRPGDDFIYRFRARAGETLSTHFAGPAARLVIRFPGGGADGPGFAEHLRLHRTGRYRIDVTPDTMADGIFGRFRLSLRLR